MTPGEVSSAAPQARDPVEELAEVFLERYRRGERPALSDFIARAPKHAEEIRELFPALVLMEQANPASMAIGGPAHLIGPLERLGDYRLLREVGRGGMGVVFEAVQEALGRHVALKILPTSTATDSKSLLRFRREARAAARLHHTNIVPVFDIGESDGVHYYAMQFIQGQGLDEVIAELRRLRPPQQDAASGPEPGEPSQALAVRLAGSLRSGQFGGAELAAGDVAAHDELAAKHGLGKVNPDPGGTRDDGPHSALTDSSDLSTQSDFHFYRSVARIGLQVAAALAYAHGQRVLHRDIKPSNLLLDGCGTVWVTDFGLAKEEGDDLTRTGDIVGTLRYMAPERLAGVSEARSDVYGLGVTLYELLTLRPAFAETDRAGLVHRIARQEPVPPRKLDRHVPRDLETIVLKAIAKEPTRRYAAAADMEEDLRRFLMDRPIRARRTSQLERTWRWCRRNPGWAGTLAAALSLLMFIAVGGSVMNLHLRQALSDVQVADHEKTERLWQAHLQRARALRSSGRVGQRFEALAAIREAAKIKVTAELRDEAVAALVLPDVEIAREWEGFPEGTLDLASAANFERYARINKQGELTVCRLSKDGEQVIAKLPAHGTPRFWGLHMSPDGRYLAYGHSGREGIAGGVKIWKLDGPAPTDYMDLPEGMHLYALSFHPDGRHVAVGSINWKSGNRNGMISIYDLDAKVATRRWRVDRAPNSLAFNPKDGRLAATCNDSVRLFDRETGKELMRLRLPKIDTWSFGLAWHPDGRVLAATSLDTKIHLWDTITGAPAMAPLEGHNSDGIFMAFNSKGDRLISAGWDQQARLWDTLTGRMILTMPGNFGAHFSRDDALIGMERNGAKLRLWRVADSRELRTIGRAAAATEEMFFGPMLDAEDRVLASASTQGLAFFDFDSGKELARVRLQPTDRVLLQKFVPTDGWLTHSARGGVLWPVRRDPERCDLVRIGPPRMLAPSNNNNGVGVNADGRFRVFPQNDRALLLDRDRPGRRVEIGPLHDVRNCAVSPDGKWVVTCSWFWDGRTPSVRVWEPDWETQKGRHVVDLPLEGASTAAFSPDGKWLATSVGGHTISSHLWEVGTWRVGRHFKNICIWNADGQLLAVHDQFGVIRWVRPESGKEVFRLIGPDAKGLNAMCMTRDGAQVIAWVPDARANVVFDLRLIRKQLQELGMDWDLPELARLAPRPPISIAVDPGVFRRPVFESDGRDVAAFSILLGLQPINPDACFHRGLAYGRLQDWRLAVGDYEMFLALTPGSDPRRPEILRNYAQASNNLAWASVVSPSPRTDVVESALYRSRKAVELYPDNVVYQNTLGVALYRLGRYEEAVACLEKNARQSGKYAAFDLYFLSMCHHRLGQPSRAQACFDQANSSAAAETTLSPAHRQELAVFRAEAEKTLGISKVN